MNASSESGLWATVILIFEVQGSGFKVQGSRSKAFTMKNEEHEGRQQLHVLHELHG
jgi:hypothetical protein